jgi:hypothetical protein
MARPNPFVSCSLLLVTTEWWIGGGSNVVIVIAVFSEAGVGRRGMAGAGSSYSGVLPLLGGVLKGDDFSVVPRGGPGSSVVASVRNARATGLLAILGFSARLTGGGGALKEASRRSSPDLRGGGGEGGLDAESWGDFPGSRRGVLGLLGILKCLGEDPPEAADNGWLDVDR